MEQLPALPDIHGPDPRAAHIMARDPSFPGGFREATFADHYEEAASLTLPPSVPEGVRSSFAIAQAVWTYSWHFWPLGTASTLHALLALDLALWHRVRTADQLPEFVPRKPSLTRMLERAVTTGWLTDAGVSNVQRLLKRQSEFEEAFGPASSPQPPPPSGQEYVEMLAETMPLLRNQLAHPQHYWHGTPGMAHLELANVRDLIIQLFP